MTEIKTMVKSTIGHARAMLLAVWLLQSTGVLAAEHHWKQITAVQPPGVTTECLYFQLAGVAQADPVAPGPWFAVPTTHAVTGRPSC